MTSSEPSENLRKGCHFTEMWNGHMIKGFTKIVGNEIAENEEEDEKLEKGYCDEINHSITKAFVMCNIPFSIIENPWFINLIKTLQPGYDPLSKQVLSGTLLESETSHVNICIMNKLSADNNFTIGKIF
ncbi:hypothetical protein RhiirA5_440624 [Rhizophagus irregularis]|uniref:Uncharacterized protein n=1 Tax=Rhizophagus irregularis TaxID=588596 RepID=A0A2N0NGH9_9GLOM|nr:hypothetical protein RhiirA5_440624 [Rhizophagus irregularis]